MIYVEIRGNLGNQLFIYAMARKLQIQTGQKICLNLSTLERYFPQYKFSLPEFIQLSDECVIEEKKLPFWINEYSIPMKIGKKILSKLPNINKRLSKLVFHIFSKRGVYIWREETYIELPLDEKSDYYLSGFWQSEKFFPNMRGVLRDELLSKAVVSDHNRILYNMIKEPDSICVSIRRGDYVSNPKIRKVYDVCDTNYFYDGVMKIIKNHPKAKVICFSDDIDWVKNNIDFGVQTFYESGKDSLSEKILLMSSCQHFVLANSSFCWWAEYLSDRNGTTIAPKWWYADHRPADIYNKNWVYLD